MPAENDREWNLQRLAAENGRWAEEELRLIETIRKLRGELEHVTAEMARTGAEHDALEAEHENAGFRAWADAQADEYSDFLLTTQPPRPNPLGLFKEPG